MDEIDTKVCIKLKERNRLWVDNESGREHMRRR